MLIWPQMVSINGFTAQWLDALYDTCLQANRSVLSFFHSGNFDIWQKPDGSPATNADVIADRLISEGLASLAPDLPIVSEENTDSHQGEQSERFWLVDPIDGTANFVRQNPHFTVNIGLIDQGKPVFGMVTSPVTGDVYFGLCGHGAWKIGAGGQITPITVRQAKPEELRVIMGRRNKLHPSFAAYLEENKVTEIESIGSSIKLCLVASGEADFYPCSGPTMEWDTAAGHAILASAGGALTDLDGVELSYGKKDFANPAFMAQGAGLPEFSPQEETVLA